MVTNFDFDVSEFKEIKSIHLIIYDDEGNKIDKIGIENIQDKTNDIKLIFNE